MPFGDRIVLHVDMDAFFAQAEVLADPRLRGRPVVVGGFPGQRGAVATASYEARAFGVSSGMSLTQAARLCPEAVFLPCHSSRYFDLSARLLNMLLARSPAVEAASIDEAYLDLSRAAGTLEGGRVHAESIQAEIRSRLSLSSSIGVGPNKLIAKMASGLKKPGGITVLDRESYVRRFGGERVGVLYGVGPSSAALLESAGIMSISQLASCPAISLARMFGAYGPVLGAAARGDDESPVIPNHETPDPKSLGHEYTLPRDESDRTAIRRVFLALADEVAGDLRREGWIGRTLHVKVRYADFTSASKQCRLGEPTASSRPLFRNAWGLFSRIDTGEDVRLLGIAVSGLIRPSDVTIHDLFDDGAEGRFEGMADRMRGEFGKRVIQRASLMAGTALRRDGR